MPKDLGEYLILQGKLTEADCERVVRLEETSGESFSTILLKLGLVSERDRAEAFAHLCDLSMVDSDDYPEEPVAEEYIATRFLKKHQLLPLEENEERILAAVADPQDRFAVSAIEMASGKHLIVRIGTPSDIEAAYERLYGEGRSAVGQIIESISDAEEIHVDNSEDQDIEHLKDMASEAPVIRLVNLVITRAVESRASDIHFEPFQNRMKVRYRIDGVLKEIEAPPAKLTAAVISRIKIMSRLNIAERRLPQDGRIQLRIQGKEIDLRVSTVPTMYGESVVMRILDKGSVVLDFEKLGFFPDTLATFQRILARPHGILLVTGPTGSGKTTTLYTALNQINTTERKILTVEDPIEYQMEGINQIQVQDKIGLTFSRSLRAIVRQDPDVIMIGEMRDLETAAIGVQSALTGHLVLSTLHTNEAAGGVTRLLEMGVEDYLLTSTVNGILAQRLVRKLCVHCRETYIPLPEMVEETGLQRFVGDREIELCRPVGCKECSETGYRGRFCILEFLVMSEETRRLVLKHADAGRIERQAKEEGMSTMYEDGLRKAVAGITTIEEIMRVTQES